MSGSWRIGLLCILWWCSAAAVAESRFSFQGGYAFNRSQESYYPLNSQAGYKPTPPIDIEQAYLGVTVMRNISERLSLGMGTRIMTDTWPMSAGSGALWALDLLVMEYAVARWLTLRGSFGAVKSFENKPAYGTAFGFQALVPLTERTSIGLGLLEGPVGQEQRTTVDGPDMEGGEVKAYYMFLEWNY